MTRFRECAMALRMSVKASDREILDGRGSNSILERLEARRLLTTFTEAQLLAAAQAFPVMPRETTDLAPFVAGVPTFTSGTPFNDLAYTLLDTDYADGENGGADVFMPVDPSKALPGTGTVKYIRTALNMDLAENYGAAYADRIILGTAEIGVPFFSIGPDGVDNDYAVIQHFDYQFGSIQLRGSANDYALRKYDATIDGVATSGHYLFYINGSTPDLIAFVFNYNDIALPVSGNPPQDPNSLGNGTGILSLSDPAQFVFAQPVSTTIALAGQATQVGTNGKEIPEGIAVDAQGNTYLIGSSDGTFNGSGPANNRVFVSKQLPDGTQSWTTELNVSEGTTLKAGVADAQHLYVAGRALGALSGFTSAGKWDGILLKLRLSDGAIVATNQWGNRGIDGYGNIELDGAGNLFVSGQGSPSGSTGGTDEFYLVAKHRTSDLSNVWRQIDATAQQGFASSAEAWGGLTFVPSTTPGAAAGEGRLVVAGWVISGGGANAFAAVYENLTSATPTRPHSVILTPTGTTAEWILDSAVDTQGNIYVVGYTTGNLSGQHRGEGDAFIARYDPTLSNRTVRQLGTIRSDMFSKLEIDENNRLYATGYSYGNMAGTNADATGRTGDVVVYKFDTNLNTLDSVQFGTPHEDRGFSTMQGSRLIIGGMTEAAMGGVSRGSFDGYVVKLDRNTLDILPDAPRTVANTFEFETRMAISIVFDSDVSASLARDDFQLVNQSTGVPVSASIGSLSYDAQTQTATLTVTGLLSDGQYRLTLNAPGITNSGGLPLTGATTVVDFHVLAGDVDRDRDVDFNDLLVISQNYGSTGRTLSNGNVDYSPDGSVGFNDLLIVTQRYGTNLFRSASMPLVSTRRRSVIVSVEG
jgi:hypothetical protein